MALSVVQHKSAILGSGTPGSITLTSTPTVGNLIVVLMHCNLLSASIVQNTTDWTEFENPNTGGFKYGSGVYRYVQGGDTSTLPVLWTVGTTYWAYEVYEISGVSGVFSTDVPLHNSITTNSAGTSLAASGTLTTTRAGAIALVGVGQYNGNTDPTLSAGWTRDEFGHNNSNYGSQVSGEQTGLSSGTGITATVSFTTSSNPMDLIMLVIQLPPVTTLAVTTAGYIYTPQSILLKTIRKIALTATAYVLSAKSISLFAGKRIIVDHGAYLVAAQNIRPEHFRTFKVDGQSYQIIPYDLNLTVNFHRHMYFSEMRDGAFRDWHAAKNTDFTSFFNTCQSLDTPNLKTQVPYVYTFLRDGGATDQSAFLTVQWDWADDDTSVRVQTPTQIYRYRNGYLTAVTKNKIRGKGRSYHMKFTSDPGKDFDVLGWVVFYDQNANQ